MQLPTVPSFTQGESGATNALHMQQLGQCVNYLVNMGASPIARYYKSAAESLGSGSWTAIVMGTVILDTDGDGLNGGIVINTQGYYRFEANMAIVGQTAGAADFQACFASTIGGSNPHYSQGTNIYFGGSGTAQLSGSGISVSTTMADICPFVCFPGDFIQPTIYMNQAGSNTDTLTNSSATAGWFTCQISAKWIREGS